MTRLVTTLCAGALLGACSTASSSGPSAVTGACDRVPGIVRGGGEMPPAIVYDVAARRGDFFLGVPGQPLQLLTSRRVSELPSAAGGQVFIAVVPAVNTFVIETWSGSPGGCLRKLANGVIESLDPGGHAMSILWNSKRSLVDASGHELRKLPAAAYVWTNDGQLAGLEQSGRLTVYSAQGREVRHISLNRWSQLGTLGPHSLIFSGANLSTVDITDGKVTALQGTQAFLVRGSPDGRFVALTDTNGQPQLLSVPDRKLTPLRAPGPITGLLFSNDSAWLSISTRLGGVAYRVGDGHVVDLGAVNIVAWM
jgi:hypothetical protein